MLKDGQHVCPRCALLGKPNTLQGIVTHVGFEVLLRGIGFMALGAALVLVLKWALVLLGLGGVGVLLHLGMKHAHLPLGLAVVVGAAALVAAFFLLRSTSSSR